MLNLVQISVTDSSNIKMNQKVHGKWTKHTEMAWSDDKDQDFPNTCEN